MLWEVSLSQSQFFPLMLEEIAFPSVGFRWFVPGPCWRSMVLYRLVSHLVQKPIPRSPGRNRQFKSYSLLQGIYSSMGCWVKPSILFEALFLENHSCFVFIFGFMGSKNWVNEMCICHAQLHCKIILHQRCVIQKPPSLSFSSGQVDVTCFLENISYLPGCCISNLNYTFSFLTSFTSFVQQT